MSKIPKIPLVRPYLPSYQDIESDICEILDTGRLSNFGPYATALEEVICQQLCVSHALTVSSATTGLCLLLNTLPEGSEVILPSFTFIATAQALVWNRLTPVFAEIQTDTLNISPQAAKARITTRTSAILGVHAFGSACDNGELWQIAQEHGIKLFFDSAHALGSKYRECYVGGYGDAEVFSLSATKLVPSGEGGLVTTNSNSICQAILDRRNYGLGNDGSKDCYNDGLNGKLPEFNAILALREVETLDWRVSRRNWIASIYREFLSGVPGLKIQTVRAGNRSTYKDFTIQVDPVEFGATRDQIRADLHEIGIESAPYFWPAIHSMRRFKDFAPRAPLFETERVCREILSIPIYETMTTCEIETVALAIRNAHEASRSARHAGLARRDVLDHVKI